MASWTPLARVSDCPPGTAKELVAGDRVIALFRVDDDTFCALDGVCPHQGGPLGKGTLDGCVVTCPWHGWQFDVCTGENQINRQIVQPWFDVRVEDGWVLIDLERP
ncbi:MAG: non-heme iron oxygenase ferredoxin subunit [Planctomycetota bacterium]|nr:MAG: non-heme iron oxygenase ferredoxin subunit [Planctomycetota bacterium]